MKKLIFTLLIGTLLLSGCVGGEETLKNWDEETCYRTDRNSEICITQKSLYEYFEKLNKQIKDIHDYLGVEEAEEKYKICKSPEFGEPSHSCIETKTTLTDKEELKEEEVIAECINLGDRVNPDMRCEKPEKIDEFFTDEDKEVFNIKDEPCSSWWGTPKKSDIELCKEWYYFEEEIYTSEILTDLQKEYVELNRHIDCSSLALECINPNGLSEEYKYLCIKYEPKCQALKEQL